MKLIKGTHHISLKPVGRAALEETVHFYRDILGLEVVRSWNDGSGYMLWTGSSLMEINDNGVEKLPQGSIHHFAFATDDLDACIKTVNEAGYPIYMGPKAIDLPTIPPCSVRVAFCKGPVGEDVEFFQEV